MSPNTVFYLKRMLLFTSKASSHKVRPPGRQVCVYKDFLLCFYLSEPNSFDDASLPLATTILHSMISNKYDRHTEKVNKFLLKLELFSLYTING